MLHLADLPSHILPKDRSNQPKPLRLHGNALLERLGRLPDNRSPPAMDETAPFRGAIQTAPVAYLSFAE
jgi:hypothetical protein